MQLLRSGPTGYELSSFHITRIRCGRLRTGSCPMARFLVSHGVFPCERVYMIIQNQVSFQGLRPGVFRAEYASCEMGLTVHWSCWWSRLGSQAEQASDVSGAGPTSWCAARLAGDLDTPPPHSHHKFGSSQCVLIEGIDSNPKHFSNITGFWFQSRSTKCSGYLPRFICVVRIFYLAFCQTQSWAWYAKNKKKIKIVHAQGKMTPKDLRFPTRSNALTSSQNIRE
ncbi:hypothetical protein ElyMa_006562600 [Elysia marginata]|uniref:Uncharacterized protein n=1 Tax=Elysia marginata TaxID=1093978 RepID=A0AAV4IAQ3_9GAST|nr:hypothetical protein ElyMa_006562600 [Elysia marginata]